MHQHVVTSRIGLCLAIICGALGRPIVAQDTAGRARAAASRDYVQPADVAVIEIYRGPAELPETLPQDKCGGLFIWTKR